MRTGGLEKASLRGWLLQPVGFAGDPFPECHGYCRIERSFYLGIPLKKGTDILITGAITSLEGHHIHLRLLLGLEPCSLHSGTHQLLFLVQFDMLFIVFELQLFAIIPESE